MRRAPAGMLDGNSQVNPLSSVLVVSVEQAVAAPLCTSRLADAGARVIKVERPEGDFARGYDSIVNGGSAHFDWLNRGKESVRIDMTSPEDVALLQAMVARADVFVQNLKPGAAERLGFGSSALRNKYPRLITCDISGYGSEGPMRDRKAYDLLIQCETGLASITGSPERPGRVGISVADLNCGLNAYTGILEALLRRERTGKGSGVSVSLFDGLSDWMAVPLLQHDYGGNPPKRVGIAHPSIAPYGAFRSKDGVEIVISVQNEREWVKFADYVMCDSELAKDAAYSSNAARLERRQVLEDRIAARFSALTSDEIIGLLEGADIAFAKINDVGAFSRHPHLRRIVADSPQGPVNLPAPPVRWADRPAPGGIIPDLGEHDAAVRREFLLQTEVPSAAQPSYEESLSNKGDLTSASHSTAAGSPSTPT